MIHRVLLSVLALLLVACASDPNTGQIRRDRNLISAEEIAAEPIVTAHELVSRLRPNWLRNRGPTSITRGGPTTPLVYIDEVRTGGLDSLYRISSQIIREIRFINGRDATTKWGLDHGGGVIMVLTGR
jgi:hypothetical protein